LFQVGLVVVGIAFIVLALSAWTTPYFPIDLTITRRLQAIHAPLFSGIMRLISWPGYVPQSFIISAGVIGLLAFYGFRWEAWMSLAAVLFETALNEALKLAIHRLRPPASLVQVFTNMHDYSFPSGHVMFYVGFLVSCVFWSIPCSRNPFIGRRS
jgi:membrane-associated phospholipid phosphatase